MTLAYAIHRLPSHHRIQVPKAKAVPGLIVCVQTFGSMAHPHPNLHVLMTDCGLCRDEAFVVLPTPPKPRCSTWRRAVLGEFVRRCWLEKDEAAGMLAWPHSGFGAYVGARIEEREEVLRVACYSARARSPNRACVTRAARTILGNTLTSVRRIGDRWSTAHISWLLGWADIAAGAVARREPRSAAP